MSEYFMRITAAFLILAGSAWAQVTNTAGLQSGINAFNNESGNKTITITADFTITSLLSVTRAGDTLTIRSDNGEIRTLSRGIIGNLITVTGGAALTLENIIIDGNMQNYGTAHPTPGLSGSLVLVGNGGFKGTFNMREGATLRNNYKSENGAGIYVDSTGVFNMSGGEISGNRASGSGGGIYIQARGAVFNMSGGEVSQNSCGASAASYSGGVHFAAGISGSGADRKESVFILGGTAVIKDNTKDASAGRPPVPSNVYMGGGRYVTLGNASNGVPAPQAGMNVHVTKVANDGIFVNFGATDGMQEFFTADASTAAGEQGGVVWEQPNKLRIVSGYAIELHYNSQDIEEEILIFDMRGVGYTAAASKEIHVVNVGTKATGALTADLRGDDAFQISGANINSLEVSSQAPFTVAPKLGLAVGTYSGFVFVEAEMDNPNHVMMRRASFEFTVGHNVVWQTGGASPAPAQTVVENGGGISAPGAMSKSGYIFSGWFTDASFGAQAQFPVTNVQEDRTFYAKWLQSNYDVRYNLNGGAQQSGGPWNSYPTGNGLVLPTAPTRDGYIFFGWFDNENFDGERILAISSTDSGDKEFWARWSRIIPTFSLTVSSKTDGVNDGAGGTLSGTASGNYQVQTLITITAIPEKGYAFSHWSAEGAAITGGNPVIFEMPAQTVAVTANFTRTYSVNFNSLGGTQISTLENVRHASQISPPTAPTRAGFDFDGWFKEESLQTPWNFGADLVTSATTLFAKWRAIVNENNLTVIANEGGTLGGTTSGKYSQGTNISVSAHAAEGFIFIGWSAPPVVEIIGGNTSNPAIFIMPGSDVTLRANFAVTHTVRFNSISGTPVASIENVTDASKISEPPAPTRAGFSFGGWYREFACLNRWDFETDAVSSSITLFAKWTELIPPFANLLVSAGEGGTVGGATSGNYSLQTNISVSAHAFDGFVFVGWSVTGAQIVGGNASNPARFSMPDTDVTLKANFTQVHTVNFDSHGGSAVSSQNAVHGQKISAPIAPTRSSFAFGGWYKDADCRNAWDFESDLVTSSVTLYAKWTLIISEAYGISLNRFGEQLFSATYGYENSNPATLTVNVSNIGNQTTNALNISLSGENADKFKLTTTVLSGLVRGTASSFGLAPVIGLEAGVYRAAVTVGGANVNPQTFSVTFTVAKAPQPSPSPIEPIRISDRSFTFPDNIFGKENSHLQFDAGDGFWIGGPVLDGLVQDSLYTVSYRFAESKNYLASDTRTIKLKTFRAHTTPVRNAGARDTRYGILLENAVVSEPFAINVIVPENARLTRAMIFDALGNIVFVFANSATGAQTEIWDLKNQSGREVASGTYLIVAEAANPSGRIYRFSARVGVKR